MDVTIFGKRIFADIFKKGGDHSGLGWALNPTPRVLLRGGADGEEKGRARAEPVGAALLLPGAAGIWGAAEGASLRAFRALCQTSARE